MGGILNVRQTKFVATNRVEYVPKKADIVLNNFVVLHQEILHQVLLAGTQNVRQTKFVAINRVEYVPNQADFVLNKFLIHEFKIKPRIFLKNWNGLFLFCALCIHITL